MPWQNERCSAGEGRTVLFVSHNMQAIKNLCTKSVYLVDGKINSIGDTETGNQ